MVSCPESCSSSASTCCNLVCCFFTKLQENKQETRKVDQVSDTSKGVRHLIYIGTYSETAAWSDYDNDGFLDLAIATCKNATASPQPNNLLYRNNGNGNNWLKIKLEGVVSNRAAIGAKVRIKTAAGWQLRDISAQSGYNGQNSLVAHFSLVAANSVDSVSIEWLSGIRQYLTQVAVNQQLFVVEEAATPVKAAGLFQQFAVQPNPVQDVLNIYGNMKQAVASLHISLTNTMGRVVLQEVHPVPSSAFSHGVDLKKRGIAHGMYYLTLRVGTDLFSTKIIVRNAEIITSRFGRWLLATPNLRFPPDFPQLLSVGAIAFVGHVALATLPSCALSAGKIPTPKTRTYYCDVP